MSCVTVADISGAVKQLGIGPGDIVLVHSSYKSLGGVEGGAAAVIAGFENVIGREGTLVMPTLSQVDFFNSYKTWYMDKPSDTGYLTEFFRKQLYVYRSNQATHSVAARGKYAYELTFEHTAYGPHLCPFGEYAFADSSPWLKMYNMGGMNKDMFPAGETLVLNANHPLVKFLGEHKEEEHANLICEQLYDLAMLSHRPLAPEAMTKFVDRTNEIMLLLTK